MMSFLKGDVLMTKVGKIAVSVLLVALIAGCCPSAGATALDDYVAAPDANYTYSLRSTVSGPGYAAKVWAMTSQAWRNASEVNRTLWEHWLIVIVPNTVSHAKSLLWIGGGSNGGSPPSSADPMLAQIATVTHSIVAELRMIPNQPLRFADETDPRYVTGGRSEDALIAYAWDKYKTTGDGTWLPRLPMTKAVVRAMDTVQAEHPAITGFVVAGASKRGWTTWTTAAVDAATSSRVEAIIPLVIDVLNVEPSMQHHWDAYGYWAPAIHDYVDMGIPGWFHTPEFRSLLAIVDPYSYVDRLTMPKFIINSTGDQFFLPDSSQFYFDALKGEKYLRYVPNTDHSLNNEAIQNLTAYYESYLTGTARPQFSWTKLPDGSLRVQTATSPTLVRLWKATNPTARNFRLDTIGAAWTSTVLADQGGGLYVGAVSPPAQGWSAFFVELEYPGGGAYPFKFTTAVSVVPGTLPYRQSAVESWRRY
jgi:PhoPQ-activated pathogenicity-related protein